MTPTSAPLRKALIVKFGQIGDVIMAIPAARALYEQGFAIEWVCGHAVYPLLECYSWIRPILVDDRAILRGSLVARARAILALWGKVAFRRYDLCATLYYDRRFWILALPVRAGRKLMLSHTDRKRMLIPGRHHTDEFVRVLLGLEDSCNDRSTKPVRPDQMVLSPLPAKVAPRRIVLVPGGTSNVLGEQVLRRWPVENYFAVARELLLRGWEVIVLGGPEDGWVKPYFQSLDVTYCIATLSLPEVVAVCDASDAIITHDTGPLHLAGLSTACLIGLFGPTHPATRVPRRPLTVSLWGGEGFACRPCYDGRNFAPCKVNGCMREMTPQMIVGALDRVLANGVKVEISPQAS